VAAYATRAQLYVHGLPQAALANVTTADQDSALEAASREIDRYLVHLGTPLATWTEAESRDTCVLAAYDLMLSHRVNGPGDELAELERRYQITLSKLQRIAEKKLGLPNIVDATTDTLEQGADGWADDDRGWSEAVL
jgi:phage gp36-like protein